MVVGVGGAAAELELTRVAGNRYTDATYEAVHAVDNPTAEVKDNTFVGNAIRPRSDQSRKTKDSARKINWQTETFKVRSAALYQIRCAKHIYAAYCSMMISR